MKNTEVSFNSYVLLGLPNPLRQAFDTIVIARGGLFWFFGSSCLVKIGNLDEYYSTRFIY